MQNITRRALYCNRPQK